MDDAFLKLIEGLPDTESPRRFLDSLAEKHPADHSKLTKNAALLSDVLTLVAFSPLLAATLLQNPEYIWWLSRKRRDSGVTSKEDLLESLGRFSLTNSQLEPQVLFARFRRRELLRIYLRDIRRLATIAEVTEEISNLADAILESALKLARREMDNRFGPPQETDEKGRSLPARFCVAALGKLGSRELNYSSDIDLLYLYSAEGTTSGTGARGSVTNLEYFVKLAEFITKLVGEPSGDGSAYRVDLRLRPHGTLGPIALSANDAVRYYETEARGWERQVMVRSRGCAGDVELFRQFFTTIEGLIFSTSETVETALANVRRSKEQIDLENVNRRGFNVKLGRGGIREIEFLAQALQLAHGGRDRWLRSPHTLISLSRLADRRHLSGPELTGLSEAYEFLRRTEHVLQMENGLQTHTVPEDPERRSLLARRVTFAIGGDFESDLISHSGNVSRIFSRVFSEAAEASEPSKVKGGVAIGADDQAAVADVHAHIAAISPHFAAILDASMQTGTAFPDPGAEFIEPDYEAELIAAVRAESDLRRQLAALRQTWRRLLLQIAVADIFVKITVSDAKRLQTLLAEASIAAALEIVKRELSTRYSITINGLPIAILALGKLAARSLDYTSDLDLIIVYDDSQPIAGDANQTEYYGRAVEIFVTVLSAMTRDGNLYRVDLRLRPYGSKGLSSMPAGAFLEYIRETAEIWEMLAFVKMRAVGGDMPLATSVERDAGSIIHKRARNPTELKQETRRVRLALEQKHARTRRGKEFDIKYGSGGMLDVYFAMRYLQLRENLQDTDDERSTLVMLERLHANGSLTGDGFRDLLEGYEFLSALDHNLRLVVGHTTRLPLGNESALKTIATRMNAGSPAELLERLTLHRLAIRGAFERLLT